jgi:hypothetical protein
MKKISTQLLSPADRGEGKQLQHFALRGPTEHIRPLPPEARGPRPEAP